MTNSQWFHSRAYKQTLAQASAPSPTYTPTIVRPSENWGENIRLILCVLSVLAVYGWVAIQPIPTTPACPPGMSAQGDFGFMQCASDATTRTP